MEDQNKADLMNGRKKMLAIQVSESVHRAVKAKCAELGITMNEAIVKGLSKELNLELEEMDDKIAL